jgi:UDP-N-acetylglucosamine 1-carboxyvinyltransferase
MRKKIPTLKLLKIKGGITLKGEVEANGAKNAITKMLVASLVSDKICTFYNVPNIDDVEITLNMCKEIGMEVNWDKKTKKLQVQTTDIKTSYVPQKYSGANRIPILMIGSLLGRVNHDIIVPTVGGDDLGKRPVNFHIDALQKMGAKIEYRNMKTEGAYFAQAHNGLLGCNIKLDYPSVGATENILLAAISAKGKTVINNAAIEPEIIDLILFLQKMGGMISLTSDRTIEVYGTTKFNEVEHTVITDRNEVISYALAAIGTKGEVFIKNAQHIHLVSFLNTIKLLGAEYQIYNDGIKFFYDKPLIANIHLQTDVHPGFMTDWQQPLAVLLTQAKGFSIIHETVYENRFGYTKTLQEMGASLELFKTCLGNKQCRFNLLEHRHSLVINGPTPLQAKNISIPDLRAGFAYVMAALIAKDESTISNIHYLERGYENLTGKLQSLGAPVREIILQNKNLSTIPN